MDDVAEPGDSQSFASPAEPRCGSSSGGEAAATAALHPLSRAKIAEELQSAIAQRDQHTALANQFQGAVFAFQHLLAELDK